MPQADQIVGCLRAPSEIVDDHTVDADVRNLAVHRNSRNTTLQQPMKRCRIGCSLHVQDTVDLSREEQLDIGPLPCRDVSRMAQQETVATREDRVIHALGQCSKIRVGGVGDDETDGARSLQTQTLGDARGAVTQGLDRPEDPLARCLRHRPGPAIHHITDRGDGDARALRDLGSSGSPLGGARLRHCSTRIVYSCYVRLHSTSDCRKSSGKRIAPGRDADMLG